MADIINLILTAESDFPDIEKAGTFHQGKSLEHILAFSYCVKMLKDKCKVERGGTAFTRLTREYWGLNHDQASKFLSIGERYEYFNKNMNVLPASYTTLALLTKLPEDESDQLIEARKINPHLSGEYARRLTKKPIEKGKPPRDDLRRAVKGLNKLLEAFHPSGDQVKKDNPEFDWSTFNALKYERESLKEAFSVLSREESETFMKFVTQVLEFADHNVRTYGDAHTHRYIHETKQELLSRKLKLDERDADLKVRERKLIAGDYPLQPSLSWEDTKFFHELLDPEHASDPNDVQTGFEIFKRIFMIDTKPWPPGTEKAYRPEKTKETKKTIEVPPLESSSDWEKEPDPSPDTSDQEDK